MTEPGPAGATDIASVKRYLALTDNRDDEALQLVVDAVNALVLRWHGPPPSGTWPAHFTQGAAMLAARVFRRRNSPNGVEDYGSDLAGAVYTRATDPDIAQLLEVGRYARPQVG